MPGFLTAPSRPSGPQPRRSPESPRSARPSRSSSAVPSAPSARGGPTSAVPSAVPSPRRAAALALASVVLLPALAVGAAAPAAAAARTDSGEKQPRPPAKMSTLGGELLGTPGTHVRLRPGAPKLPGKLTGRSWVVADAESGEVLAAHNAHWRLPPASTLKMLFADTVLPLFPREQKHTVQPSDLAGMGAGSSLVGIKEHQTYTVRDLWLGVFLRSGNDAVHVLSEINGGKDATVRDMQKHAEDLNALDTHVVSPDGYDADGQVSSAYDLTLFARSGLQKADFREYCATATTEFPGEEKKDKKGRTQREAFAIQNTNRLLTGDYGLEPYDGIAGVKNGYTSRAGSTFTGVAQRGERILLVTVMNPSAKEHNEVYRETAALFDWGFAAAGKVEPVGMLVPPVGAGKQQPAGRHGKGRPGDSGAVAAPRENPGGAWTAALVTVGALVVLGAGALVVRRRWPLPELVRRPRD